MKLVHTLAILLLPIVSDVLEDSKSKRRRGKFKKMVTSSRIHGALLGQKMKVGDLG